VALRAIAYAFADRFELAIALAGADDEIIGDRRKGANVPEQNVLALFFGYRVDDRVSQVQRFQAVPPQPCRSGLDQPSSGASPRSRAALGLQQQRARQRQEDRARRAAQRGTSRASSRPGRQRQPSERYEPAESGQRDARQRRASGRERQDERDAWRAHVTNGAT
jgi:hypothetical protein